MKRILKKYAIASLILSLATGFAQNPAHAARLKDLASFKGVRSNQLIGYGLIVGLNGTGDSSSSEFMQRSLGEALARMGISADSKRFKVKNVAAVMVTAELPPFARQGSKIDVLVSSVGDAKNLQGGTLLMTPLKAANQEIYAVAQGPISIGGFIVASNDTSIQQNHPTVGRIANGASVEREVELNLENLAKLDLSLHNPDFTTALRMSNKVNELLNGNYAKAIDSGSVEINVPSRYQDKIVQMIARMESLEVEPDTQAKVILNERTGTIVMGENVRISTVAVAHGNLTIQVTTEVQVSQPNMFAQGETKVVPQTSILADTGEEGSLGVVEGLSIGELVKALNDLGVTPRDLIAILQAIKAAGALQADIEIS
jgi:flagellar P-ring protein precursor FlgI